MERDKGAKTPQRLDAEIMSFDPGDEGRVVAQNQNAEQRRQQQDRDKRDERRDKTRFPK